MAAKFPREGGSSRSSTPMDLQDLLKKLVLKDEELDDVVLPREDFNSLREEARWMAVVKDHTTKCFGNQPFFQRMDVWPGILPGSGRSAQSRTTSSSYRCHVWGTVIGL
jgi:hypothetical protein